MTYTLSILMPEKVVFEEPVYSVSVPGADGYLEVLAHHAPCIVLLQPGKLTIINKDRKKLFFAVSIGFLEVSNNQASIVVSAIESLEEIDPKRAQLAYERAKVRLEASDEHIDIKRAKRAFRRAENRLKLHQEFKAVAHPHSVKPS